MVLSFSKSTSFGPIMQSIALPDKIGMNSSKTELISENIKHKIKWMVFGFKNENSFLKTFGFLGRCSFSSFAPGLSMIISGSASFCFLSSNPPYPRSFRFKSFKIGFGTSCTGCAFSGLLKLGAGSFAISFWSFLNSFSVYFALRGRSFFGMLFSCVKRFSRFFLSLLSSIKTSLLCLWIVNFFVNFTILH